ncbi:MAG: glycosyltransferase [Solidesulfovibrio sp. DCME]|uniref:glycosyltransferase n=1 Tax=Solidesulfovibrio sp. DCME TaxID=3447380 RepID=UPI003D0B56AD
MTGTPVLTYRFSIKETLRCHLVSHDPLVIISYGAPLGAPIQLGHLLADRKAYFLMGNWWSFCDARLLAQTRQLYALMTDMYPLHRYIFLVNDGQEARLLEQYGLPHYVCHHNAFLDERLFRPLPGQAKTMDAVYTARLSLFKRHALARRVPSWGLVYYYLPGAREQQENYLRELRRAMPGMRPLNDDPRTGRYRHLGAEEVNKAYNAARVGLCLSENEGGNYATTEYMLSGLPVVSTPSQGGRDVFLDPEISRIVPPKATAVANAVAELIARRIPPREVRLRTLVRIRGMRQDFIRLIESILAQEGRDATFAERFDAVFVHKMLTHPDSPEQFLASHGLLPGQERRIA